MSRGVFISLEGPDGSGKSSLIKALVEKIEPQFPQGIVLTREPGGTPISEAIRQVILDPSHQEMDYVTEALLYAASRRQHVVEKIKPALAQSKLVISDRYVDSSLVYQGVARSLSVDLVKTINDFAIEGLLPDLTLLIDVPAQVGLERIYRARGDRQFDRLDQESLAFHEKVRQAFLNLAQNDDRFVIIDGSKDQDQVSQDAFDVLVERGIIKG